MKTKLGILSECTGIDLPELEFKNEVQIIRPSEAIEAMDKYNEQSKPKSTTSAEAKQKLFDYFAQEHEINLMSSDFWEIENYMKPEMKHTAMEFAEWCSNNNMEIRLVNKNGIKIWFDGNTNCTTAELFAKFMAERGQSE